MGTSLAFHIVFAALGVGLPVLVFIAEGMWLRTKRREYYDLARSWSKVMAILFAIGAVSGTVLAFELGLLWPEFMRYAGAIIGLPFSCEGFAFFIEAIFIGLYLFGWQKLSPIAHWLTAVPIAISGAASAAFVTMANSWMNLPTGFRIQDGHIVDVQPWVAMFAKPWLVEGVHATLAAYVFTGFGVAAVCAYALLRNRAPERRAQIIAGLRIAAVVGMVTIPLQVVAGDVIAHFDAENEPAKFAALEAVEHTERHAPITIGGLPAAGNHVSGGVEIPGALSFLLSYNTNAKVAGLDQVAPADRPPVWLTHTNFDLMVGSGTLLLLIAAGWAVSFARRRALPRALLVATALSGPLALLSLETGWCVTEFGRQPWIAHGLQRTSDAVTSAPGLLLAFYGFTFLYVVLAATCWWLLRRVGDPATP